jgi:excisionase family DNA binding protein
MKAVKGTGSVSPTIVAWQSLSDDPLLDVRQIAEQLNVDVSTVRRWITTKKLLAHRIAGKLRVRTSTALRFAGEVTNE